ncbi:MAG: hypothetical protein M3174_04975, partial [Actinomycetota bacterium]|nr:hypothetical protein [Actinomycetota bacterium]
MTKLSSNSRVGARLLFVAAAVAAFTLPPTPAGAGTSTCTYDGDEVRVNLQDHGSSAVLSRDALGVIEFSDGTAPDPEPCGLATITTTDRITIEDTSVNPETSQGGNTSIILDIRQGHFANGGNEIPIKVDLGAGTSDAFGVLGGSDNDRWTFGTTKGNLQDDSHGEIEFETLPDYGFG